MIYDVPGTRSSYGRAISAEVRARMAALRVSGKQLALRMGVSQNYLAIRLRDEKPLTVDDIEAIMDGLDLLEGFDEFVTQAVARNEENAAHELELLAALARELPRVTTGPARSIPMPGEPGPPTRQPDSAEDAAER